MTEKLLTYALGRGARILRHAGGPQIVREAAASDYSLVVGHPGHRQEHAVSDEESRRHDCHEEGDSPPHGACAAWARRWRCRCSTHGAGVDARSRKTAAQPVTRFGVVYVPNGIIMEQWTPATEGAGFEFTPILKPLEPFRDQLTVL